MAFSFFGGGGPPRAAPGQDVEDLPDDSEQIQISTVALLKILKHCRAGVPHEVMGLMLGSMVDDYTVVVNDVFAIPVIGAEVTVETIDEAYQHNYLSMMPTVGRAESAVGWYHSHPGTGCFLSNVDCTTHSEKWQRQFPRAVAVVCDPILSVRGRVEVKAFRTIDQQSLMAQIPFRQATSNLGRVPQPPRITNNDILFYTMGCSYRKTDLEQEVLASLKKSSWSSGLQLPDLHTHRKKNVDRAANLESLCRQYVKRIRDTKADKVSSVGRADPKSQIDEEVAALLGENVNATLAITLSAVLF